MLGSWRLAVPTTLRLGSTVKYRYVVSDAAPTLTIRLLGPLEIAMGGRPIVVDTRKALAIVALVAAEGRPFAREELAAMFWPEADDDAARGALRRTLSALRTAVKDSGLIIGRAQVALDPADSSVDLTELERLAASSRLDDLEAAAALATGPFLAGFALRDSPAFDDWQAARAVRVERTVGDALERLAAARLAAGDADGAVEASRRRVHLDPLDEVGQRGLMELLAGSGDRAGAIRQYRELVALFDRELGVAPLRETTDRYDAIREGRFTSQPASVVAPAGPAQSRRTNAPVDAPGIAPLVGRRQELEAIETAWRASSRGGRVVLLEGEAGIGKTRLAEVVAATIRAEGGIVLASRGYPGEGAIAYGPIAELLRVGLAMPEGAPRLMALDETARLEIGRLVDLPTPLRVARRAVANSKSARVRLLEAIADALSAFASGPRPGLIWVDDIHLADDSTREALTYLGRRLAGRPVLLLLAMRREDLTDSGRATADDLVRLPDTVTISLRRLDRAEVAAIVRSARPDDVDDALIDAFMADSEGLPLHVVAALESGEPPGRAIPRGFQALLHERIASVGEMAVQILSAAAVIGRSFDLATVREASGRSEEETVEAIEELMRRGIVREAPESIGPSVRYDFAHGGMRDVAYDGTSLARRRLLHRRAAGALRRIGSPPGRDDVARYALIAGHERQAGRSMEAAEAYLEAAGRAEAVFANVEAIDHLASAIALGHPDAAGAHLRIGELRSRLGEYPAAIAALETAAALAERSALPAIEIALGRVHLRRGDLVASASHLESVLASPDLSRALHARALVERSVVALRAGDLALAGAAATEARGMAGDTGDPPLAGLAERLMGLVAQGRGDLVRAREALERSVALALDDPDPAASIAALTALALAHAAAGSVDEGLVTAARAIDACRRIGDRHLEAAIENHLADMLHEAGRSDESMDHLKRAVALFAEVGEGAPEHDPGIWMLAAW
jgi:DNA-binding SARP family transcriptional activator/tetratricopeptide (TPR) repeat protein